MREAIVAFEQALAIDPGYALARAGSGDCLRVVQRALRLRAGRARVGPARRRGSARRPRAGPVLADAIWRSAAPRGRCSAASTGRSCSIEAPAALALDPMLDLAHPCGCAPSIISACSSARPTRPAGAGDQSSPERRNRSPGSCRAAVQRQFDAALARASALQRGPTDAPAVRHYLGLARFYTGDTAGAKTMLASAQRAGQLDVRAQASLASIEAAPDHGAMLEFGPRASRPAPTWTITSRIAWARHSPARRAGYGRRLADARC